MFFLPFTLKKTSKPCSNALAFKFSVVIFLLFISTVEGKDWFENQLKFTYSPFQFHVHCPINSKQYLKNLVDRVKVPNFNVFDVKEDIYLIFIQARPNEKDSQGPAQLSYCGLARPWLGSCQTAEIVCSSPGPMFYIPTNRPAYMIWVNGINTEGLNWAQQGCYSPDSSNEFCTIHARLQPQQGCASYDPTDPRYQFKSVRIDKNHVPITTHIHGLSVRPAFDGNPLSWFDNAGNVGIGYYSLSRPQYFQQFSNVKYFSRQYTFATKKVKINYVTNQQPAGTLFYHDHGMHSTTYNVKHGLAGLYIIYDDKIECFLPQINQEKFILFSTAIDGDARNSPTQMSTGHGKHNGHAQVIYTLSPSDFFDRNKLYRIRMVNGHFDNIYTDISFSIYYSESIDINGQRVITEIDPSSITYDLTENRHKIKFSIIGADSTIFHRFIANQESFVLGAGQRMEVLIRFNQASGVPREVKYFYLTCNDGNAGGQVVKYRFKLLSYQECSKVTQYVPFPTGTRNPYTNLSLIDERKVVVKRMRPLLSLPRDQKFVINGHYMFEMAASDRPKIGTTEDWYFINTLVQAHPIHFHLINFQVVKTYSLKMVQEDCTLFQVNFLRSSGYEIFKDLSDNQLCDYIHNNITSEEADAIFHLYDSLYLEDQIQDIPGLGKISGFNILQRLGEESIVVDSNCSLGQYYKYICEETSSTIPQYYRRWKETVLVNPYSISVFRIRWAMTQYNEKFRSYPYFKIPEDQLMEFPGFVYHCHILPHEDNEMMRPFMLQPSNVYVNKVKNVLKTQKNSKLALSWIEKFVRINEKLSCHDYI